MKFRDRSRTVGWWAATVLLFAFFLNSTLAAPLNVTITSTGGTLTLGSDTIQVAGITNPLSAALQPNTNTPILTQPPFTFTASTATTNGGYHALLNQTFTVNGVTTTRWLLFRLNVFPSGHLLNFDVLPASFKLPQGDVYFPPSRFDGFFLFGDSITAPGVTNLPAADENWLLYPQCREGGAINVSISYPVTGLGGLIGNLAGGLDPIQINLTPNVPATLVYNHFSGFMPIPPYSGGGVSTSVIQTITVNGISTNIIRTLSLTLVNTNIATCPGVDTFLSISPATVTVDLGVSGKLDITLPDDGFLGEEPGVNCTGPGPIIVVPGVGMQILLHDVPTNFPLCVVTCPDDITVSNTPGDCGAVVDYVVPTSCTCDPLFGTPPPGSFFPIGTNTVTVGAVTNGCSFHVTVKDAELPTISCPGNLVLSTNPDECSRSNVTYTVAFSDNCPGAVLTQTAGLPSGSTFPKGTTINSFTVTDASGNTNTCSFTVTINDTQPPTIVCPANIVVNAAEGETNAGVGFPAPVVTDNCPGVNASYSPASGSTFSLGTTTVTLNATDAAGNTNACTFTVTVNPTGGGGLVAEFATSPMVLNRQTGLFEQSARLKNLSGATVNASRVYVLGLPSTNSLYNRSGADIPAGSATPSPFVQYNQPLAAGSNVVFLLEFYLSNLKAVTNHTLLPEEVAPANPPSLPDGAQMVSLEPGRNPLQLTNGRFLIEWASIPGRTYLIQYSGDLTNWKTVVPSIVAGGTSVQWVDDGPPKTETNPNQAGNRYYRVFLLPAN